MTAPGEIVCETVAAFQKALRCAPWLVVAGEPLPGDTVTFGGRTVVYRPPPVDEVKEAFAAKYDALFGGVRVSGTRGWTEYAHHMTEAGLLDLFRAGRDFGLKQALEKCTARRDATAPHYVGGCREGVDWCLAIMRSLRKVKP